MIGRDGRFLGPPKELECTDDKEIVAKATRMGSALDLEIWDDTRLVVRLPGRLPRGNGSETVPKAPTARRSGRSNSVLASLVGVIVTVFLAAFVSPLQPIIRLLVGRRTGGGHPVHA